MNKYLKERILAYLNSYYDSLELAHYKCDLKGDVCSAEQYGDGSIEDHEHMKDLGNLIEKLSKETVRGTGNGHYVG